jgi:alkaline phosphatase
MSPETEPLLARDRPSSVQSDEQAAAEDEALHGTQPTGHTPRNKYGFWRELGLFIWAIAATAAVIVLAVYSHHPQQTSPGNGDKDEKAEKAKPSGKRNLIFMVSDGMGPASLSMTRSFRQHSDGLPIDDVLALDRHFIGSSRTRPSNGLVTDSAAGATAFSCGMKSYNGAIAMLPDFTPCGTVLEAAKKAGYMTGLVVTTDITDATPACFASHAYFRFMEDSIAEQEVGEHPLGRVVDLILGGGRCRFLPNSTEESCRQDDKDITKLAQEKFGWSYVNDRAGFDGLKLGNAVTLPLLGLFAESDIPFEIDRRSMQDMYPSLDEMAQTALRALDEATKDSDKGFFLMIEGSRIDHAGHGNDPMAQVHEVLAYDKAFSTVVRYLEASEVDGVVVSTSDHETGGLAVARRRLSCSTLIRHTANQSRNSPKSPGLQMAAKIPS